jgi:L-lactate dehydrogenase
MLCKTLIFPCPKKFIKNTRRTCISVQAKVSPKSIGIVGAGGVGSAIASSLIHKNIVKNIFLNDSSNEMCKGVVYDLEDEAFITGAHVQHAENVNTLRHCDIIIITAGAKQKPDEPRTNLIERNTIILKSIITQLFPLKENVIIILVSNPVDVLTTIVQEWCLPYIPRNQVIGSGTYLDTQRVRVALSQILDVSVKSVHAYILGEHGDSQVFAKSISRVGGSPLKNFPELDDTLLEKVEFMAKMKAYEIIRRKGATSHGIGECVAAICESVIMDKNEVIPVSAYLNNYGVCLGWPSVVGANGILRNIPLDIEKSDELKLFESAQVIKTLSREALLNVPFNV